MNDIAHPKADEGAIQALLATIQLDDSEAVSAYGVDAIGSQAHGTVLAQLEASPIGEMATLMKAILDATRTAAAPKAKRGFNWRAFLSPLLELERDVTTVLSRQHLDQHLHSAAQQADNLQAFLTASDQLQRDLAREAVRIDRYIQAGRRFLQANPDAGKPSSTEMQFINHRERFERRLSNLNTLYVSHILSISQLKLAQSQAIDILDRFRELRDVLIPVYRQHQLATANMRFLNPEMAAMAVRTHEAIQQTVEASLRGLPTTAH